MKILAIETSCDETAGAVIKKNGSSIRILSNVVASQINIHKKYGGIFPEIASRAHTEKIIPVVEEALRGIEPDIVAVTIGPGLIGSLLIGVNFAKTLAFTKRMPIIGINHLAGHIYSNWAKKSYPEFPALILIVSGGHTGLYLMKSHKKIVPLGKTLDDAAGEAFDKVAKLLGLGYPGGPAIAGAAAKAPISKSQFLNLKLPRSMLDRKDYNFSFSGLKTAVLYKVKEIEGVIKIDSGVINGDSLSDIKSRAEGTNHKKSRLPNHYKSLLANEFQQAVIDILIGKTIQAAYEFKPKSICLCGGVSANKELRIQLSQAVDKLPWHPSFHAPSLHLSTDNAAMIGIAAAHHLTQKITYDNITADAESKLK